MKCCVGKCEDAGVTLLYIDGGEGADHDALGMLCHRHTCVGCQGYARYGVRVTGGDADGVQVGDLLNFCGDCLRRPVPAEA